MNSQIPASEHQRYTEEKLIILRLWVIVYKVQTLLIMINYVVNENSSPIYVKVINIALLIISFILLLISYRVPNKLYLIKYCLIIIQIRIFLKFGTSPGIMEYGVDGLQF